MYNSEVARHPAEGVETLSVVLLAHLVYHVEERHFPVRRLKLDLPPGFSPKSSGI